MNKDRRARIQKLIEAIEAIDLDLGETGRALADEEQEAFDAMPSALQGSERGQAASAAADALEEAETALEALTDHATEARDALMKAVE